MLYAAGADVILNGHDHDYERFAPRARTANVTRCAASASSSSAPAERTSPASCGRPDSEVWTNDYHGVLELTLRRGLYDWRFIAAETSEVIDRGTGRCH